MYAISQSLHFTTDLVGGALLVKVQKIGAGRETYPTQGDVKFVTASDMRCQFYEEARRGIRTYDEASVQYLGGRCGK